MKPDHKPPATYTFYYVPITRLPDAENGSRRYWLAARAGAQTAALPDDAIARATADMCGLCLGGMAEVIAPSGASYYALAVQGEPDSLIRFRTRDELQAFAQSIGNWRDGVPLSPRDIYYAALERELSNGAQTQEGSAQ